VRVFLEMGPGNSCVRMIDAILGDRPHLARAAHAARRDAVSQILRLVAHLTAERLPVNLAALYGGESFCVGHREPPAKSVKELVVPVGRLPQHRTLLRSIANRERAAGAIAPRFAPVIAPAIESAANVQVLAAQAQETFLRVNQKFITLAAGMVQFQTGLLATMAGSGGALPFGSRLTVAVPRSLTSEQCCAFAVGRIADVLGPRFAEIDTFPTRVRLPDGPLQLVDRITLIEGEPKSMTRGRVVTTHTVRPDRWYLEAGRIPTALSVEAGQADLFLSGFLGIDLRTRGLAVYRLLDAVVSFHRGLPA